MSGLALAGPQMLTLIKGTKLATLAQRAWNIAMNLNPIALAVTAIALAGIAIYKFRDKIFGFLKGAWNALISGLETGYNWIARLVPGMDEVSFAAKMSFEPAMISVADATAELALDAEAASAALSGGGGDSLVASFVETATAAEDTATAVADAAEDMRLAKRQFLHDAVIARNELRVETLDIERAEAADVAEVLESRRLQKRQFIHDAVIARNEAKVERLRIEQEEADAVLEIGKASATEFLNGITSTFAGAFAGGGGFMGGLQSVMTQGWGKLFLAEGETAAGGFLGKMQGVMGALGGVPLVGPLQPTRQ